MDFTISGQISRTLFTNDSDAAGAGTKSEIRDNNGGTRVRANGKSEMADGSTLGIQFEYSMDAAASLRHANVQYTSTDAGRITFGQGSEAGDGSAGVSAGVTGIGAGQDGTGATPHKLTSGANAGTPIKLGAYFGSLDGGTRTNMVRYDTPSLGPVSAAVSIGNGDRFSGLLAYSADAGGTAFAAKLGTYKMRDETAISGSAKVTLPSGLAVSAAWGQGDENAIKGTGAAAVPAVTAIFRSYTADRAFVKSTTATTWKLDPDDMDETASNLADKLEELFPAMADDPLTTTVDETKQVLTLATVAFEADPDREDERVLTDEEATTYRDLMYGNECDDIPIGANGQNDKADCRSVQVDVDGRMVRKHIRAPKMAVKAGADRPVDPSFVMAQIGYTIGDTSVAASWYKSEDFVWTGSEGTAIGFGVSHALPKVNATIHAAVQRYEVDFPGGATEETVFQLGTVVTF